MAESIISFVVSCLNFIVDYVYNILGWIDSTLGYYFPVWRMVMIPTFVVFFFVFPLLLLIYMYLCSLALYIYRKRQPIIDEFFINHNYLESCRKAISTFWSGHGWIWHSYEVVGLDNIPKDSGALLIYYHGALPIDIYYLVAHLYLEKGRNVKNVMDKMAFKIPGLRQLFQFFGSFPGPREQVIKFLKEGELVSIAPGGVREAIFSNNYSLVWQKRMGFAKAAIEAKVPILPVFTKNCRQAFNNIGSTSKLLRRFYEYTRIPVLLLYGGFPVKLTTYIGKPIFCKPGEDAYALANETKKALQAMILQYQDPKSYFWKGIYERCRRSSLPSMPLQPIMLQEVTYGHDNVDEDEKRPDTPLHQRRISHQIENL